MAVQTESAFADRTRVPVSVVMERRKVSGNRWLSERWEAVGIVAGERLSGHGVSRSHIVVDEDTDQFVWTGFAVELYRDEAESYYFNLLGDKPSVFVICRQEDDGEVAPFLVSLSYDEASSHMEVDDLVFRLPIPREVYLWVERYVLENYVPEKKRKRKRR